MEKQIKEEKPKVNNENEKLRIYCQNANGFPTSTKTQHKLKKFAEKLKMSHITVLLETGVSKKDKMKDLAQDLDISRENKMPEVEKD